MNWKLAALFLLIICLLILTWIDKAALQDQIDQQQWQVRIKELKQSNEALRFINSKLDSALITSQAQQDSLKLVLHSNKKIIKNLIQIKNEKRNTISNLNGDQLFDFFSNFDSLHHH